MTRTNRECITFFVVVLSLVLFFSLFCQPREGKKTHTPTSGALRGKNARKPRSAKLEKSVLNPEGFEPPTFGSGIRRAAIEPWSQWQVPRNKFPPRRVKRFEVDARLSGEPQWRNG